MAQLPNDLLFYIFSTFRPLLTYDTDQQIKRTTLRSLSLVSKTFNAVAHGLLYHTIYVSHRNVYSITRTLCQQPQTAALVRQMELSYHNAVPKFLQIGIPHVSESDTVFLQNEIKQFEMSNNVRERLHDDLAAGSLDACFVVLLYLCHNVRNLHLDVSEETEDGLIMDFIANHQHVTSSQSSLSETKNKRLVLAKLEEIKVMHWETPGFTRLDELSPVLQLPSLRLLRGIQMYCEDGTRFPDDLRSEIRGMRLAVSAMEGEGLDEVLRICPRLVNLSMVWGSWYQLYIPDDEYDLPYDFGGIGNAIRHRGRHLRTLMLDYEASEFVDGISKHDIGSLKDTELERLSLPLAALFVSDGSGEDDIAWLVDILPTSLRSFRIVQAHDDEHYQTRDKQIFRLMMDDTFTDLNIIRVLRSEPPFSQDPPVGRWRCSWSTEQLILERLTDVAQLEKDESQWLVDAQCRDRPENHYSDNPETPTDYEDLHAEEYM